MDSKDFRVRGAQLVAIGRMMIVNNISAEAATMEEHDGARTAIIQNNLAFEGFTVEDLGDIAYLLDEDLNVIIAGD
jgi:hypothetical protein